MTTNIPAAAFANALAALGSLKQGLQNVQSQIHTAGGDPILRMGRDGVWIYGAENVEIEPGSEWAINPLSLRHGMICWKAIPQGSRDKAELLGEEIRSMTQPLPAKESLPDYGFNGELKNEWTEEVIVDLKCITGEDEGEQVIYKPSSTGGLRAMKDMIGQIMEAIDKHPETPVPVVVLEHDTYQHKQYGKTYVPILRIVRWVSMDGVAAEAPAEAPQQAQAEPTRQRRQAAETAPQTQVQQQPDNDDEDEVEQPQTQPAQTSAEGGVRRRRRAA